MLTNFVVFVTKSEDLFVFFTFTKVCLKFITDFFLIIYCLINFTIERFVVCVFFARNIMVLTFYSILVILELAAHTKCSCPAS